MNTPPLRKLLFLLEFNFIQSYLKGGIALKLIIVEINFFFPPSPHPQEIDFVVDRGAIIPLQLHLEIDKGRYLEQPLSFEIEQSLVIHTREVVNHKLKNFEEA